MPSHRSPLPPGNQNNCLVTPKAIPPLWCFAFFQLRNPLQWSTRLSPEQKFRNQGRSDTTASSNQHPDINGYSDRPASRSPYRSSHILEQRQDENCYLSLYRALPSPHSQIAWREASLSVAGFNVLVHPPDSQLFLSQMRALSTLRARFGPRLVA